MGKPVKINKLFTRDGKIAKFPSTSIKDSGAYVVGTPTRGARADHNPGAGVPDPGHPNSQRYARAIPHFTSGRISILRNKISAPSD